MGDVLILLAAATATMLATGLGAIPVFLLGARAAALTALLTGVTVGLMAVASVLGLILPALDEGSSAEVALGAAGGVLFLVATRLFLQRDRAPVRTAQRRSAVLVFLVLLVHSLPEGFAIGTAYASDTAGLGLFVILAIALQNIPEGTSIAVPMAAAGDGARRQFWAAVGTSVPQPVGALVAYALVEEVEALLAWSFAFAGGAMLALVVVELVPLAFMRGRPGQALAGAMAGGALMVLLAVALGV